MLLILSLSACTDSDDVESISVDSKAEPATEATTEPTEEPTAEPTTEPTEEPQEELDGAELIDQTLRFSTGSWEGNTYSNSFLGMTMVIPDSWVVGTEEELLSMMGYAEDFCC